MLGSSLQQPMSNSLRTASDDFKIDVTCFDFVIIRPIVLVFRNTDVVSRIILKKECLLRLPQIHLTYRLVPLGLTTLMMVSARFFLEIGRMSVASGLHKSPATP